MISKHILLLKKASLGLLLVSLLASALLSHAQVYRVVDEDGKVTFTDNPPADTPKNETVDLPPLNTQPPLVIPALTKQDETPETSGYNQVTITQPTNDTTIPPGQRTVYIQITTDPVLQASHRIQLWYDNQPYNKPVSATSFQIGDLQRGEHSLQAKIMDEAGNIISSSNTVKIHVKRPSINSRPAITGN